MYAWYWCRNGWCLLACLHCACTHDAYTMHISMIYAPWPWCMYVWFTFLWSTYPWWGWMHYTCMMHKSICGQINKLILGVCVYDAYIYDLWSLIFTCVYDACINVCKLWCIYLLSLILIHVCMMCTHVCTMYTCVYDVHIWCAYGVYGTHIYDPGLWSWYMHVWCTYLRSLILIHVCIMQVCMMNFDPQSLALMHVWCMNV